MSRRVMRPGEKGQERQVGRTEAIAVVNEGVDVVVVDDIRDRFDGGVATRKLFVEVLVIQLRQDSLQGRLREKDVDEDAVLRQRRAREDGVHDCRASRPKRRFITKLQRYRRLIETRDDALWEYMHRSRTETVYGIAIF